MKWDLSIMGDSAWRSTQISTQISDLTEGLFGHVILYIFEILPYLHRHDRFPSFDIRSRLYGVAPYYKVIPGVFELAYDALPKKRSVGLLSLRAFNRSILGNDWVYNSKLWYTYFKIPQRIVEAANCFDLQELTLGLHYRGTDKATETWDSNPVSIEDFVTLVEDALRQRQNIKQVFIATDTPAVVPLLVDRLNGIIIRQTKAASFHKLTTGVNDKADHALLDCLLLSRCSELILTSSALSAFAKVLNPALVCWRVAASKMFDVGPYFPVAYIPRLPTETVICREILDRTFEGDWQLDPRALARFGVPFQVQRPSIIDRGIRYYRYRRTRLKRRMIALGFMKDEQFIHD